MLKYYQNIVKEIRTVFEDNDAILAAWEGGSAATGYLDEYSDLDLQIIVKDDFVEDAFTLLEDFLKENYGIKRKFRMPEPNWHGHSQSFYILEKSPEFFYVDFLVETYSTTKNRFLESNRHGNAVIWFDYKNLIDQTPEKENSYLPKCARLFERIQETIDFTIIELKKHILRKNEIDSFSLYYSFVNALVALMNIKYRPAKHDFRMRYIHRDFPKKEADFIARILKNENLETLSNNFSLALKGYDELKISLFKKLKPYLTS